MTSTQSAESDQTRLQHLVEVWHRSAQDVIALLRSLGDADWSTDTDLPGWNVRAIAAHLAHLESELAGNPQQQVEVPPAPHVKGLLGEFTGADIQMSFVGEVARAFGRLQNRPNLAGWVARCQARPGYRKALEAGGPYNLAG